MFGRTEGLGAFSVSDLTAPVCTVSSEVMDFLLIELLLHMRHVTHSHKVLVGTSGLKPKESEPWTYWLCGLDILVSSPEK